MDTPHQDTDATISLVAWGHPSDPGTFSGYSRHLAHALAQRGLLGRQYSAKRLTVLDAFSGAMTVRLFEGRPRLEVSRGWMWSARGSQALTRRLDAVLRKAGDRGPFLQV